MSLPSPEATLSTQWPSLEGLHALSQYARLITLTTPLPEVVLVAERMHGREAVSELFQFEIDCFSSAAYAQLTQLIGAEVSVQLLQADGSRRHWHGYLTRAIQLGSDGSLTRYRLSLAPWLVFLTHRRNTLMFQDKTALEIAQAVFADYPQAHFEHRVSQPQQRYRLTTQYRETDLEFLLRLLAFAGLSFYFEHQAADATQANAQPNTPVAHAKHSLIICDHASTWPACPQPDIRFHRLSATEAEDAIHTFSAARGVHSNAVTLSAWDPQRLESPAANTTSALTAGELPLLEHYDGSLPATPDAAAIEQLSRLRLLACEMHNKQYQANSSVRALSAAHRFSLTNHPDFGATNSNPLDPAPSHTRDDNLFIVLSIEHHAANNLAGGMAQPASASSLERGTYSNTFTCIAAAVPIVPAPLPRPVINGTQTALVVGIPNEPLSTGRDHHVKIQFPWQRGTAPNPGGLSDSRHDGNAPGNHQSGIWVRVIESLAGPNWGSCFVPRIGTEVLVEFINGDIDRPLITGSLYNGADALPFAAGVESSANHPGVLSGWHSHALDSDGYNQWVIDDARGQPRQRLASSYATSQMSLGYLIQQAPTASQRGSYRGSGFELRSDAWGTLRAKQGLFISTHTRTQASSSQLDASEAISQLKTGHDLAQTLSQNAQQHHAQPLNGNPAQAALSKSVGARHTTPVNGQQARHASGRSLTGAVETFEHAAILIDSAATLAYVSPASSVLFAGQHLHTTAQQDTHLTAAHTAASVSGKSTSLFTHAGGIQTIAAQGALSLQAHSAKMVVSADQSLTVLSVNEGIEIQAQERITLYAGGAAITLAGGNITFSCPGKFEVKGAGQDFAGPASGSVGLPSLPVGRVGEAVNYVELHYHWPDLTPAAGTPYKAIFADGSTRAGKLDGRGYARLEAVPPGAVEVYYGEDPRALTLKPISTVQVSDAGLSADLGKLGLDPAAVDLQSLIEQQAGRVL